MTKLPWAVSVHARHSSCAVYVQVDESWTYTGTLHVRNRGARRYFVKGTEPNDRISVDQECLFPNDVIASEEICVRNSGISTHLCSPFDRRTYSAESFEPEYKELLHTTNLPELFE
jgi:hypothetical protein